MKVPKSSRPNAKLGWLVWAIVLWGLAIALYILCVIGIPKEFDSPVLEILSQRGLVPAIGFALIGILLFSEYRK